MKIALITIHWANSYGGMLQTLASQKILSDYGEVSIIDYKTPHLKKTMQLIRFGYMPRDFLRMGKDLFRLLPRYRLLHKFKSFIEKHFNLTQQYNNHHDLDKVEALYDVFVCGSDQIWNPRIIDGVDSAYFLGFIDNKKKISFASSCGSYQFSGNEETVLVNHLSSFSNIAVREKNTAQYISHLLEERKITTVLDPTLMLNKSEWLKLLEIKVPKKNKPYVFVYTLKKDEFVRNIVEEVSNHFNLEIIVIDQDPFLGFSSDKHIQDADPKEYLELIAGASFVITNSFHGTAFSVNFEVPFISIRPESGLNRIQDFLESVGLNERLILNKDDLNDIIRSAVDFKSSGSKLEELRASTRSYLNHALNN